jgi:hypothetical protein
MSTEVWQPSLYDLSTELLISLMLEEDSTSAEHGVVDIAEQLQLNLILCSRPESPQPHSQSICEEPEAEGTTAEGAQLPAGDAVYPQSPHDPVDVVGYQLAQELAAMEQKIMRNAGLLERLRAGALEKQDMDECVNELAQPSMSTL